MSQLSERQSHHTCFIQSEQRKFNRQSLNISRGIWELALNEVKAPLSSHEREEMWICFMTTVSSSHGRERARQVRALTSATNLRLDTNKRREYDATLSSFCIVAAAMADLPAPTRLEPSSSDSGGKQTILAALAPVYAQFSRACVRIGRRLTVPQSATDAWLHTLSEHPSVAIPELCRMLDNSLTAAEKTAEHCPRRQGLQHLRRIMSLISKDTVSRGSAVEVDTASRRIAHPASVITKARTHRPYPHSRCMIAPPHRSLNIFSVRSFRGIWECVLNQTGSTLDVSQRESIWRAFIYSVKQTRKPFKVVGSDAVSSLLTVPKCQVDGSIATTLILADLRYTMRIASNFPVSDAVFTYPCDSRDMRFMLTVLAPVYALSSRPCASENMTRKPDMSAAARQWVDAVWGNRGRPVDSLSQIIDECEAELFSDPGRESSRCFKRIGLHRLKRMIDVIAQQAASVQVQGGSADTSSQSCGRLENDNIDVVIPREVLTSAVSLSHWNPG